MRNSYFKLKDGTKIYSIEINAFIDEYNKFKPKKNKLWLGFSNGLAKIRKVGDDEVVFLFGLKKDYAKFKDDLMALPF